MSSGSNPYTCGVRRIYCLSCGEFAGVPETGMCALCGARCARGYDSVLLEEAPIRRSREEVRRGYHRPERLRESERREAHH
jgi:hypothetical protein